MDLAITMCAPSFLVGGNWGFLHKKNPNFEELEEVLLLEKDIDMKKVSNGYIIFIDRNRTLEVIKTVSLEHLASKNFNLKQTTLRQKEALKKMFLEIIDSEEKKEYTILLFNINNTDKMRQNGIEYKAFNLDLKHFVKLFLNKVVNKKEIEVLQEINGELSFKTFNDIIKNEEVLLMRNALEISTTNQGAFLTFKA
jgi:hypothetical protein